MGHPIILKSEPVSIQQGQSVSCPTVHDLRATRTCNLPISGATPDGIAPLSRSRCVTSCFHLPHSLMDLLFSSFIHFVEYVLETQSYGEKGLRM